MRGFAAILPVAGRSPAALHVRRSHPLSPRRAAPRVSVRAEPGGRRGPGLVALVAGWGSASPAAAAKQPTPAQKEAELRKLNERIEKVRKSVNADVAKRDKLSVQLREAELGVASARKDLDDIRAQRLATEAQLRNSSRSRRSASATSTASGRRWPASSAPPTSTAARNS